MAALSKVMLYLHDADKMSKEKQDSLKLTR